MTATNTILNEASTDISTLPLQVPPITVVGKPVIEAQVPVLSDEIIAPRVSRKPGDEVNRFLLCSLVSKSAKQIRARVEWSGERLPMAAIIKGFLRAYVLAAKHQPELLAGPEINVARLKSLIDGIMKGEIKRHSQDMVRNNQARLVQAKHLGDEVKIKAETEALERALESRNRLAREFK